MGKTAKCLQLLQILSSGRTYHISELADFLNTNPRNVIEYKRELQDLGYEISNATGRYGGYKLEYTNLIPAIKMLPDEKQSIADAYNFLLSKSDFVNRDKFVNSMGRIFSVLEIDPPDANVLAVKKVHSNINPKTIDEYYQKIEKAIKEKHEILLTYNFLKEEPRQVRAHPYQLFVYDDEWKFFAFIVEKGEVWHLKLSRVLAIEETTKPFRVWSEFKPEKLLKNNVFTANGGMFKVRLIASGIRAKLFKEKQFGTNQTIISEKKNGDLVIELELQDNPSSLNFILGCGDLVKVLEPEWFAAKVKKRAEEIAALYK